QCGSEQKPGVDEGSTALMGDRFTLEPVWKVALIASTVLVECARPRAQQRWNDVGAWIFRGRLTCLRCCARGRAHSAAGPVREVRLRRSSSESRKTGLTRTE